MKNKKYGIPLMASIPDDAFWLILISVRDGKSMENMAEVIHKSMGMIQRYCLYVEHEGYVGKIVNEGKKKMVARSRFLTDAGKAILVKHAIKDTKTD